MNNFGLMDQESSKCKKTHSPKFAMISMYFYGIRLNSEET